MAAVSGQILVCQAGSCQRKGSEAVLLEIEELARSACGGGNENNNDVDRCQVQASGCLGLCNQAPSAVVLRKRRSDRRRRRGQRVIQQQEQEHIQQQVEEAYFGKLDTLEDTVEVVVAATGHRPNLTDDKELQSRLSGARAMRKREHAISVYRWNDALQATLDQMMSISLYSSFNYGQTERDLHAIYQDLLQKVGFSSLSSYAIDISNGQPLLGALTKGKTSTPRKIENYSPWILHGITKVSRHSAIFHFQSKNPKRGTPHPRGGGRPPPSPKTWHTTLLAEIGKDAHEEGPLPWIERDYTPISSAKEWEQGKCDILIKIYLGSGAATTWLHGIVANQEVAQDPPTPPPCVWLSKPLQTLDVPTLVTDGSDGFSPASVLLLLGGTGVVALNQILHHRNPYRKIGIATKRSCQLHVPVDLLLSCRQDDVLMLPEIVRFCQEAVETRQHQEEQQQEGWDPLASITKGVRNCTLLLTKGPSHDVLPKRYPFPDIPSSNFQNDLDKLRALPNARIWVQQNDGERLLTQDLISEAVSNMPMPCRILVSGPSGFNSSVRELLLNTNDTTGLMLEDDAITILEA